MWRASMQFEGSGMWCFWTRIEFNWSADKIASEQETYSELFWLNCSQEPKILASNISSIVWVGRILSRSISCLKVICLTQSVVKEWTPHLNLSIWKFFNLSPPQVHNHPVHWKSGHLQTTHIKRAQLQALLPYHFAWISHLHHHRFRPIRVLQTASTWLRRALQTCERRAEVETSGRGVGGVGGVGARKYSTWPSFLEACKDLVCV